MGIDVGTAIGYLDLDTSKFSRGFKSALEDLKGFGEESEGISSRLESLGSGFSKIGSTMTKNVTLPIVGVGTAAVGVASKFESAMSQVQAISGASGEDLEALTDKAKEMGASTKFSASESAEALKYMAMAGWDTEAMLDGISGVMQLAAASGESLGTTSDIVTDAMTAFGLSADQSARFADVLAKTATKSNTNVALMGETFKYVAPVAGAMGYSIEDASVAIGLMANSGIKGSQAGTSLKNILTNLVKPTDTMALAMEELGIQVTNQAGEVKPLNILMGELREAFSGLTEAEKASNAAILAGKEGMSGLLAIVNASSDDYSSLMEEVYGASLTIESFSEAAKKSGVPIDKMRKEFEKAGISADKFDSMLKLSGNSAENFVDMLNEAVDSGYNASDILDSLGVSFEDLQAAMDGSSGAAEEVSNVMMNNLSGQLTILKSTLEGIAISFGDLIIPVVKKLAEGLQGVLNWVNGLNEGQKETIVNILAIVAAVGPALLIVGKIITAISSIMKAVQAVNLVLSTVTNPIGLVIAAIAAVVAALVALYNKNEEFRNFVDTAWEAIKTTISTVVDAIVQFFTVTVPAAIDALVSFFTSIPTRIHEALQDALAKVKEWGTNMVNWAKEKIPEIVENIVSFFKELPGKMVQVGKDLLEGLWNGITDKVEWLKGKVGGVVDTIKGWFTGKDGFDEHSPSKWSKGVFEYVMDGGAQGLESGLPGVKNSVGDVISDIQGDMIGGLSSMLGAASKLSVSDQALSGIPYSSGATTHQQSGFNTKEMVNAVSTLMTGMGSGDLVIKVPVNGEDLAVAVLPDFRRVAAAAGQPF